MWSDPFVHLSIFYQVPGSSWPSPDEFNHAHLTPWTIQHWAETSNCVIDPSGLTTFLNMCDCPFLVLHSYLVCLHNWLSPSIWSYTERTQLPSIFLIDTTVADKKIPESLTFCHRVTHATYLYSIIVSKKTTTITNNNSKLGVHCPSPFTSS